MKEFEPLNPARQFKVGTWLIDMDRGGVFNGEEFSPLEPKPMEVLFYLARANGEIVSASKLKSEIWQDTHVVDEVVKRCISQIRSAFKDDARKQQIIATTPKRGYRIVEPIDWEVGNKSDFTLVKKHRQFQWAAFIVFVGVICVGLMMTFSLRPKSDGALQSGQKRQLASDLSQAKEFYDSYEFEDNESAIAIYRRVILEHPGEALAYAGLSNALMQKTIRWAGSTGDLVEAKDAATAALDLNPGLAEAHKALGLYFQEMNQYSQATVAYSNAIRIKPDYWAAVNNLGEVFREIGNWREAEQWFDCALEISAGKEQTLSALGELKFRQGDYEKSRQYFEQSLRVAPFSQDALIGLSFLALYDRDPQSAINYCNRLEEVWPNVQDCKNNSGIAALMLNDFDDAHDIFLNLSQDDSLYWKVIGGIRLDQVIAMKAEPGEQQNDINYLIKQLDDIESSDVFPPSRVSWLRALVASIDKDADETVKYLNNAISNGHDELRWDLIEPGFSFIRNDIRFIDLMRRAPRKENNVLAADLSNNEFEKPVLLPETCKLVGVTPN